MAFTRILLFGASGAGKTTLLRALFDSNQDHADLQTENGAPLRASHVVPGEGICESLHRVCPIGRRVFKAANVNFPVPSHELAAYLRFGFLEILDRSGLER